ncbi:MAG TPA: YqgE/AlgH family protein [Burkholderiales bacterium]|jgi:putative transcriptional regulator
MDTPPSGFLKRLAAGCALVATAALAHAQALDRPMLLIAPPTADGIYSQAVLVVVPIHEGQHRGFIINRVSHTTVARAFPDEPDMAKVVDPIYFGGPNDAQRMYAVVRRDPGEGARKLFDDVFVTISGATVDRVIQQWPGEARFFAGYAAWEPGELAQEIRDGEWLVAEPHAAQIFSLQPGDLWLQLLQRIRSTL